MIEVMELESDEVIDHFAVLHDDLLLGMMKILHRASLFEFLPEVASQKSYGRKLLWGEIFMKDDCFSNKIIGNF
jgi:hypothetical protein